jgi:chromatin remodeling complex protein RSC6
VHKVFRTDDVLRAIIGKRRTTRSEAVRLIWWYVKVRVMQKPGDTRIILPDERLAALTGEPGVEIDGFKLMPHIQRHIFPLDPQ